jgi:hypothetical protein
VKYATLCVPCEHDFMSEICVYLSRYVSSKRNSAAFNGIARLEDEVTLFEYLKLVNTDQFQNRSILGSQKGVLPLPRASKLLTLQTLHVRQQRDNIQNIEDLELTAASAEFHG